MFMSVLVTESLTIAPYASLKL